MTTVSISEAKKHLAKLARLVEQGETITITRNGRPVFDMVPHKEKTVGIDWEAGDRFLKSKGVDRLVTWVSPDFDDPLPEDFLITPLPEDVDKPKARGK